MNSFDDIHSDEFDSAEYYSQADYYGEDASELDIDPDFDGQPSEYEEWQDYMGGDDWDHGQYDCDY